MVVQQLCIFARVSPRWIRTRQEPRTLIVLQGGQMQERQREEATKLQRDLHRRLPACHHLQSPEASPRH